MTKVLFVCYGSGHVRMVLPVAKALQDSGRAQVQVLGLTTAGPEVRRARLPLLQFKDFVEPAQAAALRKGRQLAAEMDNVVDPDETAAYLGLSYADLEAEVGRAEAKRRYARDGRQAFLPRRTLTRILRQLEPDLVVATNSPRAERAAIEAAGELGIPAICIVDLFAIDEIRWIGQPDYADRVCVLNEAVRDSLLDAGRLPAEVVVTGNPAFDVLASPDASAQGAALRQQRGWHGKRVLLWPAQVEPALHPFSGALGDPNLPDRALEHIIKWTLAQDDAVLCIRPRAGQALPALPGDPRIVLAGQDWPLPPLLHAVDLVVTLTSTVGLEGHLAGARLVQVLGSVFDDAMPLLRFGIADAAVPLPLLSAALDTWSRAGRRKMDHAGTGATARVLAVLEDFYSPMPLIPAPQPVDLTAFSAPQESAEVKYGLPRYVHFCKRCVISNQRPNSAVEYQHTKASKKATIAFDEDGICDACRFAEQKHGTIDWKDREDQLAALCDKFRSKSGYDCLLPGSGGKDSFYASHILKTRFGMHPLTVTWAPHVYTDWGWRNFQAWLHAGFDNELTTPNGRVHRLLTRLAVENLFHPFQAFMFGQKALAPKMAILHDIPFVIYGENEAEYGNPIGDTSSAQRDWSYFTASDKSQIYLGGTSIQSLYDDFGVEPQDLLPYLPADPVQIRQKNIEVHYLGYYLKWHPQSCYYYAVEHGGFEASPERTPGTYSKYNSIDDRIDDFHYYTTFVKFGIGRATYDAAQEIRSGDITREEGVALVRRYDGEFPERFADEIFKYLSIPEKEFPQASKMFERPVMDRASFLQLADTFRSPHLWQREGEQWKLRHTVFPERL